MKKTLLLLVGLVICLSACHSKQKEIKMKHPTVTMKTNKGDIQIELYEDKAPITVKNFLRYVDEKLYDQTIFHRVINGFMIQGGGFTSEMKQKPSHNPIQNEAGNGLLNQKGTIAMARTSDVNSATSQFFINVADNDFLNYRNATSSGFGYCVFGKVIAGMDIIDQIKKVKTTTANGHQDVPVESVEILEIRRDAVK